MNEHRRKKPSIRREGVDRSQGFGGHYEPLPVNARTEVQTGKAAADTQVQAPQPAPAETVAQAPKRAAPGTAGKAACGTAKPTASHSTPVRRETKKTASDRHGAMKKVALTAYPKEEQRAALEAVASEAVPIMDMVKLAGRRALARFDPKADYQAAPDVRRMGSSHRYTTTKHVSQSLLDKLHGAVNPLGLKSDNEMLRGQFEPLFWSELDAIIEDLEGRKKN